jgi:hypothetical protein
MDDYRIVERKPGNVLTVLIKDSTKTSKIPADAAPGSTAYTADMSYMANKDIDGTWKQIGG